MSRITFPNAINIRHQDLPEDCVSYVDWLPVCDVCQDEAEYDVKTFHGPWGQFCEDDAIDYAVALGMGLGQRLVKGENPRRKVTRARLLNDALMAGDFDLADEIIGDGDIAEWL